MNLAGPGGRLEHRRNAGLRREGGPQGSSRPRDLPVRCSRPGPCFPPPRNQPAERLSAPWPQGWPGGTRPPRLGSEPAHHGWIPPNPGPEKLLPPRLVGVRYFVPATRNLIQQSKTSFLHGISENPTGNIRRHEDWCLFSRLRTKGPGSEVCATPTWPKS